MLPGKGTNMWDRYSLPNAIDDDRNTPLILAAKLGHTDMVKVLLGAGAQPNMANRHGETVLHIAALWGHTYMLKALLDRGSDPNMVYGRCTPLDYAMFDSDPFSGSTQEVTVTQLLLKSGGKRFQELKKRAIFHWAAEFSMLLTNLINIIFS